MALKYTSCPSKILAESITSAATSFKLNNINGWDGDPLVAGDFGSEAYGVFRNATKTAIEIFEFDPSTIASASITIVRRGLQFDGNLTTEVAANKLNWTKGDTYVDLGTDTPQMLQYLQEYVDNAIVSGGVPATTSVLGLVKMSTAPVDANNPTAVGDNDTRVPTQGENDALAGGGNFGTPSSSNKFITEAYNASASGLPVVRVYTTVSNSIGGDSTTRFDITKTGNTIRYTWDGIGTNPNITASNPATGAAIYVRSPNFNTANNGAFVVTASSTNYFEVTNASGVAENDKTLGAGELTVGTFWTKPSGLKYITIEGVGGGGGADTDSLGHGSGAGYFKRLIQSSSLSSTEIVIIGGIGQSSTNSSLVTGGRSTVFGSFCIAEGGDRYVAGKGGSATGGDVNISGQEAIAGSSGSSGNYGISGSSMLGLGGIGGRAPTGYGSGASEAEAAKSGILLLTEYYA